MLEVKNEKQKVQNSSISIYLAGTIKKDHETGGESHWEEQHKISLRKALSPHEVFFLDPAARSDDLSDQQSVFGRDMLQVSCSDCVLVDARERRGLGVGAEMMWAKVRRIPLIVYAPEESHYRKSNTTLLGVTVEGWTHPFVELLSDLIVSDLPEAAEGVKKLLFEPGQVIKGEETMHEAMKHYSQTQFSADLPMNALFSENPLLEKRKRILVKES